MDERNKGGTLRERASEREREREREREGEREHAAEHAVTRRPEARARLLESRRASRSARFSSDSRDGQVAPRKRTMRDVPGNIQMKLRYRRKYSEIVLLTATRSA